jgi:hypothetical protein
MMMFGEASSLGVFSQERGNPKVSFALNAKPFSAALVEKLFDAAQLDAKLSGGGLITRQLITRLGGLNGARVFKIPGVRSFVKERRHQKPEGHDRPHLPSASRMSMFPIATQSNTNRL